MLERPDDPTRLIDNAPPVRGSVFPMSQSPRSARSIRLLIVGLLSTVLALGASTTGAIGAQAVAAPSSRAAVSEACAVAQAQDASAQQKVSKKQKKAHKAKKAFKKAKKVFKKQPTTKHRKALKKAKAKKSKSKRQLKKAKTRRTFTANNVVVFCGINPTGPGGSPAPLPPTTPGVSPLQPLCNALLQLQPLCAATTAAGSTSPLQPLCTAIPQLAPLCAVKPGDLANPAALQALINQLNFGNLPAATLLSIVTKILADVASGNFADIARQLGMTPEALANLLRGLGIPLPPIPSFPGLPGVPIALP